ncbi:hypothetical protein HZS61_006353 [Fusarium oxysporum f. sp. conglutinans]|uniref:Uncharacterized protein n=1 Tax=Fusarium oxysporum f. sp. conglutinans TaxID=100902 RepID=A0A8H6LBF7_FUSOX|nr:hypothetical protein HZS61_006353 [Fusarium oxysporum f. sp. conglutinans]KAG6978577.1 hypothetical protein FocnCong_v011734 [Fusarium oxysporum f. sp. conglutinans]
MAIICAWSRPGALGARTLRYPRQRTGRHTGKSSISTARARRCSTDAGSPTKNRKTETERSIRGMVVHVRSRPVQETQPQGDHRLPVGAVAPARSLAPLAGSEVPPRGLRRVSREVQPQ